MFVELYVKHVFEKKSTTFVLNYFLFNLFFICYIKNIILSTSNQNDSLGPYLRPSVQTKKKETLWMLTLWRYQFFHKMANDLIGHIWPLLCYGEIEWFLKKSDLLIKLQPRLTFLWIIFILVSMPISYKALYMACFYVTP